MRDETFFARGERMEQLAERAQQLQGKILNAKFNYVIFAEEEGGHNDKFWHDNFWIDLYQEEAERAEALRERALLIASNMYSTVFGDEEPSNDGSGDKSAHAITSQPIPASKIEKKPRKQRRPRNIINKSPDQLAEVTASILETTAAAVDRIHRDYVPEGVNQQERKEFIDGDTTLEFEIAGYSLEKTVHNRVIVGQSNFDQVLIWTAQANGRLQSPTLQTAGDKLGFVASMINAGKANKDSFIDDEELWALIDEAKEAGLLGGQDPIDPKLTAKGFERIEKALESGSAKHKQKFANWGIIGSPSA